MLIVKELPSEPIFYDAWMIAHVVAYKADQEIFLTRAKTDYKIKMHTENIKRAEGLIEQRIKAWTANYGTKMTWNQYIDDCPRQDYVESLLAGVK
jgi:hypothetical protein